MKEVGMMKATVNEVAMLIERLIIKTKYFTLESYSFGGFWSQLILSLGSSETSPHHVQLLHAVSPIATFDPGAWENTC